MRSEGAPGALGREAEEGFFGKRGLRMTSKKGGTFTTRGVHDRLIEEALRLGGHCTKKEAVRTALEEYVQRRKQVEVLSLFGTIEYDEQYDDRRERRAKPM
jgi:hypothetical protein